MAKFVPFIIKTDGSQNISVKIVRMKKPDAIQTEKRTRVANKLAEHYVRDYGACPLPSFGGAPRYELSGEAAMNIFVTYLKWGEVDECKRIFSA